VEYGIISTEVEAVTVIHILIKRTMKLTAAHSKKYQFEQLLIIFDSKMKAAHSSKMLINYLPVYIVSNAR
jgi:hypothetical protein